MTPTPKKALLASAKRLASVLCGLVIVAVPLGLAAQTLSWTVGAPSFGAAQSYDYEATLDGATTVLPSVSCAGLVPPYACQAPLTVWPQTVALRAIARTTVGTFASEVATLQVAPAPIFTMDYTRDSGGWPGTVGSRVTHDQVRVPGGGPRGEDAIDMIQRYAPNADRFGAEFDWGWNGYLEATDPTAPRFYRWRERFTPQTNLRGIYSGDGSETGTTNKVLIVGDGCGSNCRVIFSYRGGSADGRPRYWRIALDGGVDPAEIRSGIPVNGEWFDVQVEVSNSGYKFWINNNDYSRPTAATQRSIQRTRHRYVSFGAYNNDGLHRDGVHAWRHTGFTYAREFDAAWHRGGTAPPPPPPPTPVDCAVSDWAMASATPWSACTAGTQTRTETWTRTVTRQPANGGAACPALSETRQGTQACTVAPPPPPPPATGVLFREDFAAGLTASFASSGYGRMQDQAQFAAVDGALVQTIPAGASPAYATQHFADARTGPVATPSGPVADVYASWRVFYGSGFDFAAEPKQFILGTQDSRRHDNSCCNPWTAHYLTVMVAADGQLIAEGNNKQGASGQWINLGPFAPARLVPGRWYTVEVRRRLNDVGQDNGIFTLWLDGIELAHRTHVRWRTAWDGTFGSDGAGTNFLMLSSYFNGGPRSTPQTIRYDDVVVSTSRIGAPPVTPPVDPPPAPTLTVSATGTTQTCRLTATANQAPTTQTGWGVQFSRRVGGGAWANHGSRDASAPYTQAANVALGEWEVRAVWSRTGSATVTVPALAVFTCAP